MKPFTVITIPLVYLFLRYPTYRQVNFIWDPISLIKCSYWVKTKEWVRGGNDLKQQGDLSKFPNNCRRPTNKVAVATKITQTNKVVPLVTMIQINFIFILMNRLTRCVASCKSRIYETTRLLLQAEYDSFRLAFGVKCRKYDRHIKLTNAVIFGNMTVE